MCLFSVIIPVYNSDKTIRKCLDSVLNQTFGDFEIIVINDGSTDDSSDICKEYALRYTNIRVYDFPNEGVAIARKRGITLATGEFVIFVDSDDSINTNLLQSLADTLIIYPDLDIIRYQANLINDEPNKNHSRYNFLEKVNYILTGINALKLWTSPSIKYAVYWLFAFRRKIFSSIHLLPNLNCYEDVAYIPIIIASSNMVTTIDYYGYNYTCNRNDSLTNTTNIEAKRKHAYDFYNACDFAIRNFIKINNINTNDIAFFISDYRRRLNDFFYSMPTDLQTELSPIYGLPINTKD